ncbi:MAG: biosynthetic-type acetolactate synthase large subunit [Bacteroidota bacterium]|nr:biosynthetic-type acetolactate synthase large subunit [Bacteroidota bacterium]
MDTLTKKKEDEGQAPKTKRITGSEAIILSLIEEGVEVIFGYPGGNIMPVYDALYHYQDKHIRHILARHEQGAAHAAQGYARVSGKVGVALATSGPGATNLITGIADALLDSTPLVCITGQVGSPLLGTDAFQETDVIGISMPVTKWNVLVTKAEDIPAAIAKAFYIAKSGRPGPVLIDITKDAQFAQFDYEYKKCTSVRSYIPAPKVEASKIEEAATIINSAQKPFALIGQGVILGAAEAELRAFLEKTGIPAAWTLLGNSALPTDHPLNVGMLGMHGNYGPNIKSNECDVLIAIGMRFDDRVTGDVKRYAKQAKVIHLEIDPAEVDKNVKTTVAILGDVKESLPLLTEKVSANKHEAWMEEFKKCAEIEFEKVIKHDIFPEKEGLTMGEVIRKINEKTKGEAVMVTDVGQQQMIASRYFKFNKTRSVVTSGGLGTMGFGLPAAIGAKLGAPDREVIAVIGDGGLQMTIQELGTIFQDEVPVKIVLLNNTFLGMVRQWQQLFFDKRYSSTPLINPDFIAIAKAYCIAGEKVTDRSNLEAAIDTMLNHKGPYLLEVKVEKEDNVFPMVPAGCSVSEIRLE